MLTQPVFVDRQKLAGSVGPIVKHADFAALAESKQIVAAAQRHAESLRQRMHEEIEAARQAGYAAGEEQARIDFSASVVQTVAELDAAFGRVELRIVNTVMGALQQILGRLDDRKVMEQLVRRVLNESRDRGQLRLRVAASQYDAVNGWLGEVIKEFPDVEFIDVLKDPAAPVGSCVLESEFGAIDASVEVQLAAVRRGLLSSFVDQRVAAATAKE